MATKRPKIVVYSEDETLRKIDYIAEKTGRSRSNLSSMIFREYVKEYEEKNGVIELDAEAVAGNVTNFPAKNDEMKPFA